MIPKGGPSDVHTSGVRILQGSKVAQACGIEAPDRFVKGLEAFTVDGEAEQADRVVDVWMTTPDDLTSDEDSEGMKRPKLGAGRVGAGPAVHLNSGVDRRPFHDGAGLCSPGRWEPHQRKEDAVSRRLHTEMLNLLTTHHGDLVKFACQLVQKKFDTCPFSQAQVDEGRKIIASIIGVDHIKGVFDVADRQPSHLNLAAHLAQALGDPDWRILAAAKDSYTTGVPVGYRERLPRTPAVYERKTRWKKYEPDDYVLEERGNYATAAAAMSTIRQQFQEEVRERRMIHIKLTEARARYGERLRIAPQGAIEKLDHTFRVIHDGTHGAGVNPNIRLRDQVRNPRGGELKYVITRCRGVKGATFGITVDVSKAQMRYKHRVDDWGLMACRLDGDHLMVFS